MSNLLETLTTTTGGIVQLYATRVPVVDNATDIYAQWLIDAGGGGVALPGHGGGDSATRLEHSFPFFGAYDASLSTQHFMFSSEGGIGLTADPIVTTTPVSVITETLDSRMYSTIDRPSFLYTFHIVGQDCEILDAEGWTFADQTIMRGKLKQAGSGTPDVQYALRFSQGVLEVHTDLLGTATVDHRVTVYDVGGTVQHRLELGQQTTGSKNLIRLTAPNYEVTGAIVPPLSTFKTRISAYTGDWKLVYVDEDSPHSQYTAMNSGNENLFVLASQVPGKVWKPGLDVQAGLTMHPTDANKTPFYFRATNFGTTGGTEPMWNILYGTSTLDNGIVWEVVERLEQPVMIGPLVPTPRI